MKTVLVPGAPWPKYEPLPERKKKSTKHRAKRKQTDANFIQWLEKIDAKEKK